MLSAIRFILLNLLSSFHSSTFIRNFTYLHENRLWPRAHNAQLPPGDIDFNRRRTIHADIDGEWVRDHLCDGEHNTGRRCERWDWDWNQSAWKVLVAERIERKSPNLILSDLDVINVIIEFYVTQFLLLLFREFLARLNSIASLLLQFNFLAAPFCFD